MLCTLYDINLYYVALPLMLKFFFVQICNQQGNWRGTGNVN